MVIASTLTKTTINKTKPVAIIFCNNSGANNRIAPSANIITPEINFSLRPSLSCNLRAPMVHANKITIVSKGKM